MTSVEKSMREIYSCKTSMLYLSWMSINLIYIGGTFTGVLTCPDNCECKIGMTYLVKCSNVTSKDVIASIPNDTKRLYLDVQNMKRIGSYTFKAFGYLKHLSIKARHLEFIDDVAFFGLLKLESLSLEESQIDMITDQVFSTLVKLSDLRISKNRNLKTIHQEAFSKLIHLKRLELRGPCFIEIRLKH